MLSSWKWLCLTLIYLLNKVRCMEEIEQDTSVVNDTRRPIWNIAHMVNSIPYINEYLDKGANSIEFDVSFDSEGSAEYIYHGPPCDFGRNCWKYEYVIPYLQYLQNITCSYSAKYRKELVLLVIDCKVEEDFTAEVKSRAGQDLAMKLLDYYWQRGSAYGGNAYILITIPRAEDMVLVKEFRKTLERENFTTYETKIGYDVYRTQDLKIIRQAYKNANISEHIWQGAGETNWSPRGETQLREVIGQRDNPESSFIDKVYYWTVDEKPTMQDVLRLEVDGMVTNKPGNLYEVLNETEFSSKFRLATLNDSPWEKQRSKNGSLMNFFPSTNNSD